MISRTPSCNIMRLKIAGKLYRKYDFSVRYFMQRINKRKVIQSNWSYIFRLIH